MGSLTRYRFGVFEFDPVTPELRKSGRPVRLRPQGLKLLTLLISRPREVIAREDIARFLWDAGVFVDFEQGVNHIIKQVRTALGDDAESPRYIETLPRRGYRFIAPVEALVAPTEARVRADGTEPSGLLELSVREDAKRTAEIAEGRFGLAAKASPSLSQSAPPRVIGRFERYRIAIAVVTCAALSILGAGWWAMYRPPVASSSMASVAVLPFITIGGGGDYFADGLTDALTTELGTMPGLRVIASNTAFSYRDRPSLREIARELGVGLVVTGSVQRHDARVRIDSSLVNTSDGTTLWSEHFSRQVTDVLTVQHEISESIARTLSKTVGVAPAAKSPPATGNPEAYDAYLRGLWHFKGRSSTGPLQTRATMWRSAVAQFERAVALDPEFALARAALASAYTQLFFYDSTDRGFDEKAFLEIQRALASDPNLSEAYLARAQLTWTARNRFPHEAAITDLRRALSLNANLADAHLELEKVYYHIGLTNEAIAAGEQVQRLDPSRALSSNRTFRALIDAGRLEQVRLEVDREGNLTPYARGDALVALGRLQEALQLLSRSKATLTTSDAEYDIGALALLGVVHARLEQPKEAERVLTVVIPAAENPGALSHIHHAQFHIGAIFGLLGRKADAVRWLTKAADEGYPSFPRFSTDQSLAPLKGYPAFEALLVRLQNDRNRWQNSLSPAPPQPANK